ncbi:MAG: hypothetical protein II718_08105, partial [Clostridiales bacterium]|nr:hypothetical protein [Clostridiales bacterium]
ISSEYPDCTLAPIGDIRPHEDVTYQELPTVIMFPGTTYSVYVGGEPLSSEGDVAAFDFGDGFTIVAFKSQGELEKAATAYIPLALSTKKFSSYETKVSGHGFLNGNEMDYSAGLMRCTDAPYYCVFYEMDGCTVGVITKENKDLHDAKKVLDKMASTFTEGRAVSEEASSGNSEGQAAVSDDADALQKGEPDVKKSSSDMTPDGNYADGSLSDYPDDIFEDGTSRYYIAVTEVRDNLAGRDCVFQFQFTKADTVPSEAYLVSPGGKVYAASYLNDTGIGEIRFSVSNVQAGRWQAYVSNENEIGFYDLFATDKEAYENYVPNALKDDDDIVPRIAED